VRKEGGHETFSFLLSAFSHRHHHHHQQQQHVDNISFFIQQQQKLLRDCYDYLFDATKTKERVVFERFFF